MFVWHDEVVSLESYANVVIKPHIHAYSQWNRDKILFIFPFFSIIIEKVIEKPIIMKQIVETPSQTNVLCDLFNNIYFEFDF